VAFFETTEAGANACILIPFLLPHPTIFTLVLLFIRCPVPDIWERFGSGGLDFVVHWLVTTIVLFPEHAKGSVLFSTRSCRRRYHKHISMHHARDTSLYKQNNAGTLSLLLNEVVVRQWDSKGESTEF
jgi:hypothetical protein